MKLFGLCFSAAWILCCLVFGRGQGVCSKGKLVIRINLTTELRSEILLPCLFEQALTGSNLTMNPEAVWTQINETIDHIVEIKVNNPVNFWNSRTNRIKVSGAPATGNFSILIKDVQLSDLGLYRCELYRDNCSLGYKEIEISLAAVEFSLLNNWQLIVAGGGGGGFLLLCLITVCVYYTWTKRQTVDASVNHTSHNSPDSEGQKNDEITYASVVLKAPNCHDSEGQKNDEITYASVDFKSHNCHDSEVLLNNNPINSSASEDIVCPETVIYSTIKQGERR